MQHQPTLFYLDGPVDLEAEVAEILEEQPQKALRT